MKVMGWVWIRGREGWGGSGGEWLWSKLRIMGIWLDGARQAHVSGKISEEYNYVSRL